MCGGGEKVRDMEGRVIQFRKDEKRGLSIFLCLRGGFIRFLQLLLGGSLSFHIYRNRFGGVRVSYKLFEVLIPFHRPPHLTIFGQSLAFHNAILQIQLYMVIDNVYVL